MPARNGSSTGTQLGDCLAAALPNPSGATTGGNDPAGRGNADAAALSQGDFAGKGVKLGAQVPAAALAAYATNPTPDGTGVAAQYGFAVGSDSVGAAAWGAGPGEGAFGVANCARKRSGRPSLLRGERGRQVRRLVLQLADFGEECG